MRFGGDQHQNHGDECIAADADRQIGEVRKLHVGNDNPKDENLRHRPGTQDLQHAQQARRVARRSAQTQWDQESDVSDDHDCRDQDGSREHQNTEFPKAALEELNNATYEDALLFAPSHLERHEWKGVRNNEQDQRGAQIGQRPGGLLRLRVDENIAAPGAGDDHSLDDVADRLKEAALVTFDKRPGKIVGGACIAADFAARSIAGNRVLCHVNRITPS